jgi:hypothetical protein
MAFDANGAWVGPAPAAADLGLAPAPAVSGPPLLPLDPVAQGTSPLALDPLAPVADSHLVPQLPLPAAPVVAPALPPPVAPPAALPPPVAPPAARGPGVPRGTPGTNPDAGIIAAGNQEAGALREEGQAAKEGADQEAAARQEGAKQLAEAQQQLREQQVQRDQASRQLNEDTQQAYDKARDTTIPDFWGGDNGKRVAAAVLVGLGAVGQGLTAFGTGQNLGNGAQVAINHAVDTYAEQQKQRIDSLFRYAEAKGKLNEQQKQDWATKLNDLQYQIAFIHQSIGDHIAEVNAQAKGKIDQTHFGALAAAQAQTTQQQLQQAMKVRADINHMKAEEGIGYYNAKTSRMAEEARSELERSKASQVTDKEGKTAVFAPELGPNGAQRVLGYVTSGRGGAQAFSQNDANYTKAINSLKAYYDDIVQNGERVFGIEATKRRNALKANADIAIGTVSSLGKSDEALAKESASIGSSGGYSLVGANPEAVQKKIAEVRDQQERYRTQGLINYGGEGEGGAPASTAAAAPATPIGARATSGGKPIVYTANGWQYAS